MNEIQTILGSTVRLSAPLAFGANGEYVAEKGGTLNISLEAMLLAGAFFSVLGASVTGSVVAGFVIGMLAGWAVSWVHANMSHRLTANTFVVGLTLNVLLLGLTNFLLEALEPNRHQAARIRVPLLVDIPVVGPPLFENRWPVYLLIPLIPLSWWLVNRTNWGLELRACGENPQAADVTGINVNKRRRQGLYYAGLTTGLGGAYLALGEVGLFNQNMTAGRGFLINAAIIFGGWRLGGAIGGCILFGGTDAMRLALPAIGYEVQPQILIALPYVLAIVAMSIFAFGGRPAALGKPFERGVK
ncbi:MAG: ABC transporter permease [Acidimicrobiaceae bacterium]|nr:ABC transporter permease [Acidimicrobiaceae bacterium]